ncbi:MAG: pantoate--beta-alanine ligase [Bacteroidia bacterium]
MKVVKSGDKLTKYLNNLRREDKDLSIGFVPTMGALHDGHLSLIKTAVSQNDILVCSIFVNPTQFGEESDLVNYPKPIEDDIAKLTANGCDILFLPNVDEIYPKGYQQIVFDLDGLDLKIEGAQRPGHFQGVCNVLKRFFEITDAHRSYFGQKDFQQTIVAKKLVSLLGMDMEIVVLPIAREPHGLAMSSRNIRLSDAGRMKARFIRDALLDIKKNCKVVGLQQSLDNARNMLSSQEGAVIEYLTAVDTNSLEEVAQMQENLAVVTVVRYEGVRLLDNIILN